MTGCMPTRHVTARHVTTRYDTPRHDIIRPTRHTTTRDSSTCDDTTYHTMQRDTTRSVAWCSTLCPLSRRSDSDAMVLWRAAPPLVLGQIGSEYLLTGLRGRDSKEAQQGIHLANSGANSWQIRANSGKFGRSRANSGILDISGDTQKPMFPECADLRLANSPARTPTFYNIKRGEPCMSLPVVARGGTSQGAGAKSSLEIYSALLLCTSLPWPTPPGRGPNYGFKF